MVKGKFGKKNKKGPGKLAKMTENERLIYFEQQRLAELEAKRKKEELLSLYLSNKLEKEEQICRKNTFKINQTWRMIMREIKSEDLRQDLNVLAQTFERVFDRKNSILKSLLKEMEESEEQYMMSLRNHLHNIDLLAELQNQRLERMKHTFDEELSMMKREFDDEKEFMACKHLQQIDDLKDIYVAFDKQFLTKETEARNEYGSTRDELKNKSLEDKHALRTELEKKVNILWAEYLQCKANYNKAVEERRAYYEVLKARDEQAVIDIERQMLRLRSITTSITSVKTKLARVIDEYEEKNRLLREEREKLGAHFLGLKSQINDLHAKQHVKLTKMAIESNNVRNKMRELNKQCEQIILLGEHSRKLETEEEKVLPFYVSSLSQEEEQELNDMMNTEDEEVKKLMKRYEPLENFWRRFNKAQLDKFALMKERDLLQTINNQNRSLLAQYLDGLSVNEDILSRENSLFIVNGRSNLNFSPAVKDGKIRPVAMVKLEAAHIAKDGVTSRILQN